MSCLSKGYYSISEVDGRKVYKITWMLYFDGGVQRDIWHNGNALLDTLTEIGQVAVAESKASGKHSIVDISEGALDIIFIKNQSGNSRLIREDYQGDHLILYIGGHSLGMYQSVWPNHGISQNIGTVQQLIDARALITPEQKALEYKQRTILEKLKEIINRSLNLECSYLTMDMSLHRLFSEIRYRMSDYSSGSASWSLVEEDIDNFKQGIESEFSLYRYDDIEMYDIDTIGKVVEVLIEKNVEIW